MTFYPLSVKSLAITFAIAALAGGAVVMTRPKSIESAVLGSEWRRCFETETRRIYFDEIAPPAAAARETVWLTEHYARGILIDGIIIIDGNGTLRGGCAGLVSSAFEGPKTGAR